MANEPRPKQPSLWAITAVEAAKRAFATKPSDPIEEKERKMALSIDASFGALVAFAIRQRKTYGPNEELDQALAAAGVVIE